MSTRANIIIENPKHSEKLWFYRHSDGYPDVAMPSLHKFMEWLWSGKIRDNVGQSTGWLILIGAGEYNEKYVSEKGWVAKTTLTEPDEDWKCGAYEPTTSRHGYIEYIYVIDLDAKALSCYSTRMNPNYDEPEPDGICSRDRLLFVDSQQSPWNPETKVDEPE